MDDTHEKKPFVLVISNLGTITLESQTKLKETLINFRN